MAPPDRAFEKLTDSIDSHPNASLDTIRPHRLPPRAIIDITHETIPADLRDLFDKRNADVVNATILSDDTFSLRLTLEVSGRWKDGGTRSIRAIGASEGLTIPTEALSAAGVTEGDTLDVHARDGELHFREHYNGPRLP